MTTDERKRRMEVDGFCIIDGIIPADVVEGVRDSVVAVQQAQTAASEAALAKTRARGHRIGVEGV